MSENGGAKLNADLLVFALSGFRELQIEGGGFVRSGTPSGPFFEIRFAVSPSLTALKKALAEICIPEISLMAKEIGCDKSVRLEGTLDSEALTTKLMRFIGKLVRYESDNRPTGCRIGTTSPTLGGGING